MRRLERISPKVLIFRAIKIAIQIAPFSQSLTSHDWLHALGGCSSPVPGTADFNCERSSRKKRLFLIFSLGATPWYFPDPRRVASFYLEQGQRVSFGEQEVEDSEPLELDWLLKCNLEELIASVRPMSAKNCEQIVRAILDRIGGPTFEQLLTRIVGTMVPRDGRGPPTLGRVLFCNFPQVLPENDVLGRLLCFAMRMCQLRIEKNPNLTAH